MAADPIVQNHDKELARLRRRRRFTAARLILFVLVASASLFILYTALGNEQLQREAFIRSKDRLLASGAPWVFEFITAQEHYRDWLERRGTHFEVRLFNQVGHGLLTSAAAVGPLASTSTSFLTSAYISLHLGVLRAAFLLIACWRLWVAVLLLSSLWGAAKLQVYRGRDLLGLTGNGRLFYSGARADLRSVTSSGAPTMQVTGLACPPCVPLAEVRAAEIGKLLDRFGASTQTTQTLAGFILAAKDIPAYVAPAEEEPLLKEGYEGAGLLEHSVLTLERALLLHAFYRAEVSATPAGETPFLGTPRTPHPFEGVQQVTAKAGKLAANDYATLLGRSLDRVLTPEMKVHLATLRASELAALVLAFEAGKTLSHSFEGSRWIRRSNFPQLSARAVLHSVESFAEEHDYDRRTMLRRALVYGARHSPFGSVRFPVDLSPESRAARQWVELLMAMPYALQSVTDEVELFGLVGEMHTLWSRAFLEGLVTSDPKVTEGVIAGQGNLLFIPLERAVEGIRRTTSDRQRERLEELVFLVSQRQRLHALSMELMNDGEHRVVLQSYERVFTPLTHQQMKQLAEQHDLSFEDLRLWSSARVVLNAFGWLGRRVGDYSVPESSVIYTVFKGELPLPGSNELGLCGRKGMVPLRATRVEARLGKHWRQRFVVASSATMAETPENYERLLKGAEDISPPEPNVSVVQG